MHRPDGGHVARAPKAPEVVVSPYLPVPAAVVAHHAMPFLETVKQWRDSGKVAPVNLIVGPHGIGKTSLVYHVAQTLLCENAGFSKPREAALEMDLGPGLFGEAPVPATASTSEPTDGPCGECPACQKALRGNWVDFTEISTDPEDGENASLKIDQFRNLKATLGFGAFDGTYRIILIREADRLTAQAANSLLKILEEPPKGWIFFLTASDTSLLLPTLVSRCQTIRLRPLPESVVRELLEDSKAPKDRQAVAASLSQGSWSLGLRYCEDETWEARKTLLRFLDEPAAEITHLVDWAASDARNFSLLLDQLEQFVSELVKWSVDPTRSERAPQDSRKRLTTFGELAVRSLGGAPAARDFWYIQGENIARARLALRAPLNKKLVVQDLLMPWLKVA